MNFANEFPLFARTQLSRLRTNYLLPKLFLIFVTLENHSLNVIRQNLDSSIQSQTLKNTWLDNANSLIVR